MVCYRKTPREFSAQKPSTDSIKYIDFSKFPENFFTHPLAAWYFQRDNSCFLAKIKTSDLQENLLNRSNIELRLTDTHTKLPGDSTNKHLILPKHVLWTTDISTYTTATGETCQVFGSFIVRGRKLWVCIKNKSIKEKSSTRKSISPRIRWLVFEKCGRSCCVCGATAADGAKLEVDHIQPVSRGGSNNLDNLQILCRTCNSGKGALYDQGQRDPNT